MKGEEIKKLVAKRENAAVEFKRAKGITAAQAGLANRASQAERKRVPSVPADFWPSYSSFANTDGGTVILGVREKDGKREIEGLPDAEKTVADIWNAVNNAEKISANVLFNESVYPGEGDYHCSRETVEGMIRDKRAETADNCVIDEMTVADLNADTIRRYRMYFSQLRPGHVWSGLSDEGFLMKIGAAVRGRDGVVHPTMAGLVCFGDDRLNYVHQVKGICSSQSTPIQVLARP